MTNEKTEGYELRLERLLDAPRANVWGCWTEPKLLEQWFAPPSWTTEVKTLELRPGGASHIVMRGPDGEESDGVGVFLEAVPEQRLVFTNAFTSGWIPIQSASSWRGWDPSASSRHSPRSPPRSHMRSSSTHSCGPCCRSLTAPATPA